MYCLLIRMLYLYNIEHDHTIRVFRLDGIRSSPSWVFVNSIEFPYFVTKRTYREATRYICKILLRYRRLLVF